jgi:hypothetical protein
MSMHTLSANFNQAKCQPIVRKTPLWKAAALAAGLGLGMLSYPVQSAPASGGETVQGLYDALLNTMKIGRTPWRYIRLTCAIELVGELDDRQQAQLVEWTKSQQTNRGEP